MIPLKFHKKKFFIDDWNQRMRVKFKALQNFYLSNQSDFYGLIKAVHDQKKNVLWHTVDSEKVTTRKQFQWLFSVFLARTKLFLNLESLPEKKLPYYQFYSSVRSSKIRETFFFCKNEPPLGFTKKLSWFAK